MPDPPNDGTSVDPLRSTYLTTAYSELCRSYQALHDFRMKLLGLLPIASIIGLLALGKDLPKTPPETPTGQQHVAEANSKLSTVSVKAPPRESDGDVEEKSPTSPKARLSEEVVGYIGMFSSIFTLALFGYEVRSLLMCHDYSMAGAYLESEMNVYGQFRRCDETRQFACYQGRVKRPLARIVNDKVTSSLVYSFVFAAWFFVGLRYVFSIDTHKCVWWAFGIGIAVASASLWFLRSLTRRPSELEV